MPFGGVLFASGVVVAKAAHKRAGTYGKPAGGMLTVRSELGEPVHKIARCRVKLWKEVDDTAFKLPKEERMQ